MQPLLRSIVHLDADAFFASVEQAADARLRGKPIAVGGEKRGIIASASYEARKFGVYTPMPTIMARRLCPKLILLPGDFEKYELFSRLMFSYAYDFTPDVEIGSIDEGYFDLTGVRKPAVSVAETVRHAIRQALKLSVSEGIAANKLVSQIASKLKKPAAFEVVPLGGEAGFLSPLANKWLPGIGPKLGHQFNAAGLARIGQIAHTPIELLELIAGSLAPQLRNFARGIDQRPVVPARAPAKSYGEQETFAADTTDEEFLEATLRRMADKLMAKVREDGKSIRTVTVKVRYNDMDEQQASESLEEPTDLETEIYSQISALLRKAWQRRVSLRLVSLKLSNIYEGRFWSGLPLDVSARNRDAQERLSDVVDQLRQKFGRGVVLRGHDFILRVSHIGEVGRVTPCAPSIEARSGGAHGVTRPTRRFWGRDHVRAPATPSFPVPIGWGGRSDTFACNESSSAPYCSQAPQAGSPAIQQIGNLRYDLAVVQRQRVGKSVRNPPQSQSPWSSSPELRFRVQTDRTSTHASRIPHHAFRVTSTLPLNVHSYYSFLDSTLSPKAIIDLARRHELPAIALTDKNNLHGAVEFAQAAAEAGIKPIIGAEIEWHGQRVCLYVENQLGYRNLCRILNRVGDSGLGNNSSSGGRFPLTPTLSPGERENHQPQADRSKALRFFERRATILPPPEPQGRARLSPARRLPSHPPPGALGTDAPYPRGFQRGNVSSEQSLPKGEGRGEGERVQHSPALSSREGDDIALFKSTEGLLALSPCADLARFFPDRFYFEVNNLDAFEKRPTSTSLPCVASFPVHYELPSDRWKYDIIQSIRTLTLLRQQHPEKRLGGEYHFRPAGEMQKLFSAHPELLARSYEIAERCSFNFSLGKPQFPGYPPPDGLTPAAYLHQLVTEGLQRRYPEKHSQLKPQLEQELAIIIDVGYEEYFLVMWDILQECRRRGIEWITRGSAADSLACYCLEISGVCPIRFDLYFRRFLNKDRMALNKLPDIDVDFPHDRKDDVVDLIFEKYGPDHTAVVGGFSTFQSRSAFAEIAKVLGVSEFQVRRLTERLPHYSRATELAEAIDLTQECRDLPFQEEPYRTALHLAAFLDGFPRYPKMHPCGLVLSRQAMDEITPCFTSAKGYPTTHFDMDSVEAVGLVKMDILAQGGLAVMRDVLESVGCRVSSDRSAGRPGPQHVHMPKPPGRNTRTPTQCEAAAGRDVPRSGGSAWMHPRSFHAGYSTSATLDPRPSPGSRLSDLGFPSTMGPWDDLRIWELIASGNARAVHHIESPAMISLCKMCNVHDIDTLIAIVSVIRPGAANESKKMEFARRYQRLSPVRYPHPSLEPCLRSTYGLVVYEEHILQICEAFAGLPPGRADVLRRALGKNKTDLIDEIQIEFADCARKHGRAESEITEVWNLVAGFSGYAFCKAHSTAYGVEAYQAAWLKLNYPAEFMAAVLTNGKGFYSPLVYVLECHRLGIPLLPPSVNEPGPAFSVVEDPVFHLNDGCRSSGPFPLTPALSLMGRENHRPRLERAQAARLFASQNALLPLPKGKSRDEGEVTVRLPPCKQTLIGTKKIRIPIVLVKGLTTRTKESILSEHHRGPFSSLTDFFLRIRPLPEEMESLIRVGAFDEFGKPRTAQYWEFVEKRGMRVEGRGPTTQYATRNTQLDLFPQADLTHLPSVPLSEPTRLERLRAEEQLLGYPASGHPLELFPDIAWNTYCPINQLGEHIGEQIVTCGLVIEQRLFHQVTGEPMKFITIADWTGMAETELFAKTYKSYGLNTVRYRVLEITATVEPFENGRGHTLRVLRAGKPRYALARKGFRGPMPTRG